MPFPKEPLITPEAPAAIGPYSQAVRVGQWLFLSGQIALDPRTGLMVGSSDIRVQTDRVLQNVAAVLKAAGTSLDAIVKTTVYLVDLEDFPAMNEIYAAHFSGIPPARATVQVARLPRDARVEIDAIAVLP